MGITLESESEGCEIHNFGTPLSAFPKHAFSLARKVVLAKFKSLSNDKTFN